MHKGISSGYLISINVLTDTYADGFLLLLGMGRTWQIFARICLPCGRNLSSVDIAKCDPEFSS